jgi:hypothetical protein
MARTRKGRDADGDASALAAMAAGEQPIAEDQSGAGEQEGDGAADPGAPLEAHAVDAFSGKAEEPATAASAKEPAAASPPAPAPAAPPWRRVAFCLRSCSVALGHGVQRIFGGDWIVDQSHAKLLARDPHFRMIDVSSPARLAELQHEHKEEVERITKYAAELGLACHPDGEYKLDKLRHM